MRTAYRAKHQNNVAATMAWLAAIKRMRRQLERNEISGMAARN